jgi:hypothetical protein
VDELPAAFSFQCSPMRYNATMTEQTKQSHILHNAFAAAVLYVIVQT